MTFHVGLAELSERVFLAGIPGELAVFRGAHAEEGSGTVIQSLLLKRDILATLGLQSVNVIRSG